MGDLEPSGLILVPLIVAPPGSAAKTKLMPAAGVGVGVGLGVIVGVGKTVGVGVGEGVPPGVMVGVGEGPPGFETTLLGEITQPATTTATSKGAQNIDPALMAFIILYLPRSKHTDS